MIFSATKAIVAGAVWMLIQEGTLDITLPVAHDIPEFGTNGKDVVTVEQVTVAGTPARVNTTASIKGRHPSPVQLGLLLLKPVPVIGVPRRPAAIAPAAPVVVAGHGPVGDRQAGHPATTRTGGSSRPRRELVSASRRSAGR